MQPNSYHEAIAEEHRRELLREAAHTRLVHEAGESYNRRILRRIYGPALAFLGRLMLAWGARLTETYSSQVAHPKLKSS